MKITLEAGQGNYSIHSYAAGQICVSAHPSVSNGHGDRANPNDESGGRRVRSLSPSSLPEGERDEVSLRDVHVKETLTRSCVILPDHILRDWPPQRFSDLRAEHFAQLLELKPEIVVLGSGDRLRFPAPALTAQLFEQGIGVEVMDTGAACRTYNILMSEGRRVAAALLMI